MFSQVPGSQRVCLWISTPVKSLGFEVGYRESAAGASALCRTVSDRVAAAGGRVCAAFG